MAEAHEVQAKVPSIAILGGCGFIGRNLVKFLLDNDLAQRIKVADKKLPALSFLPPDLKKAFKEDERIVFQQNDLAKQAHVDRFFKDETFDYVFHLCGETRAQKNQDDYRLSNEETVKLCLKSSMGVKKYIFVSDARVYKSNKVDACKENAKIEPWTKASRADLNAEKMLKAQSEVPYVILRPALIYGPGDQASLLPRLMTSAIYQEKKETMKFLWNAKVHINCVHVSDVCNAMWECATKAESGKIYNLADKSALNQGKFNKIIEALFNVKTGFVPKLMSMAAKKMMNAATEHSNDKHVPAWGNLCQRYNILNTPLTPFMDVEILKKEHVHVDGSLIEAELGFKYKHEEISVNLVRESVQLFIDQNLFPPVLSKS